MKKFLSMAILSSSISITLLPIPNINTQKIFNLTYIYPEDMHGWFGTANQNYIRQFVKSIKPGIAVEVGSWLGVSAIFTAKLLESDAKLYCIDPWLPYLDMETLPDCQARLKNAYERFLSNCIHHKVTDKIIPMRMKSIDASQYFEDQSVDFIYIDGSHQEDDVYADLITWFPKLKKSGKMCGDDYGAVTVRKAVDRAASKLNTSVKVADGWFWYFE